MNKTLLALMKMKDSFNELKLELDFKAKNEVLLVETYTVLALTDIIKCAVKRRTDETSANN